jgi:hypothetical protein
MANQVNFCFATKLQTVTFADLHLEPYELEN